VNKTRPHPHPHEKQELAALTTRLRREARKITGPRAAILEILRHHPHPLTNKEIFAQLPKGQCDLATIYRAMQMLEKLGMVQRFDFGDGAARFELVREGDDGLTTIWFASAVRKWWKSRNVFRRKLKTALPAPTASPASRTGWNFSGFARIARSESTSAGQPRFNATDPISDTGTTPG
jgi:hypothetical protein